tara:strand:- start:535 stop:969 length:435 start_codon:yes stop_codon:yes gene_type:complete
MTIENYTNTELLNALIARGVLTQSQADSAVRKADRALDRQVKAEALNLLKSQITEAITAQESHVFSVKKTGNSIGVMDLVEAERGQVLKALTQLTSEGVFRKVGLVGGVEKPTSEVNAFQIRYIRNVSEAPAEFETNEADEEAK